MAGRAGRRGLDEVGIVIICCFGEEPPPENILRQVLTGSSTFLRSKFRLTYNMILNLLRVEEMSVESMIKRSFSEFATQRALTANNFPHLLAKGRRTLAKLEKQLSNEASHRVGAEDLEQYFGLSKTLLSTNQEVFEYIHGSDSSAFVELFAPGRLLLVTAARDHGVVREPAIVLRLPDEQVRQGHVANKPVTTSLVCMLLLPTGHPRESASDAESARKPGSVGFVGKCDERHYSIQQVGLGQIFLVLDRKIKIDVSEILKEETKASTTGAFFGRAKEREADIFSGMKAVGKKKQSDAIFSGTVAKKQNQAEMAMGVLQETERYEIDEKGLTAVDLKVFVQRGADILLIREACHRINCCAVQARTQNSHHHPSIETHYINLEKKDKLEEKVQTLMVSQNFLCVFLLITGLI